MVVKSNLLINCLGLLLIAFNAVADDHSAADWQQLGRLLFEDQTLSLDGQLACASCHLTTYAMADPRARPEGRNGVLITRNAPSLLGLRQHQPLFWDGRREHLSQAVLDPFFSDHEQALSPAELVERVAAGYAAEFGGTVVSVESIAQAIVAYLQALPSVTSAFDQWRRSPESITINPGAKLGYELFTGRAGCADCHLIAATAAALSDDQFHNHKVGTRYLQGNWQALLLRVSQMDDKALKAAMLSEPAVAALGRYLVTGAPKDIGAFRTPSLRNVMRTAPYMHDGSMASIEAVIERELYYSAADHGASFRQPERQALIEFLILLNDEKTP